MQNQWVAAFSDETSEKELTDEQKQWGLAFGTIKPEKTESDKEWIDAFKNY
ncbi:hypothetical protein [Bacillus toyonensis]|uniref:hypothetical protein n=1 Tax=Bacillus toyonensis TaxID=155322 RepID=UPI0015D51176|nr:hypothetical protein [Bacillus toyonensis]